MSTRKLVIYLRGNQFFFFFFCVENSDNFFVENVCNKMIGDDKQDLCVPGLFSICLGIRLIISRFGDINQPYKRSSEYPISVVEY